VSLVLVLLALSWAIEIDAAPHRTGRKSKPKKLAKIFAKGEYFKPTVVPKGDTRARPPLPDNAEPIPSAAEVYDPIPLLKLAVEDTPVLCATEAAVVRRLPTASGDVLATLAAGEKIEAASSVSFSTDGDFIWVGVKIKDTTGFVPQRFLDTCPGRPISPDSPRMPRQLQATTTSSNVNGYPLFKQCNAAWKTQKLGTCSGQTICSAGCAVSSVAMILAKRGLNQNPSTLNTWLTANGGYANGCSIYWSKVDKLGKTRNLGYQSGNYQTVCGWIKSGRGVIGNVNNGGHYVLLTGCDGKNNYFVNDPGFSRTTYPLSGVKKYMVYV